MEITATLKKASWAKGGICQPYLRGIIYGDIKGRFKDGTLISTSSVLKDLGDGIFQTRNSTYKVDFLPTQAKHYPESLNADNHE